MDFEKTIDLPSSGLLEGSKKTLQIGSMDMKAEKAIYTRLLPTEKLLKIVSMCSDVGIEDLKKFPFSDLVYAFVRIRVQTTEDPRYTFRSKCGVCDESFPIEVNFDAMDVKFLEEILKQQEEKVPGSVGENPEPFAVNLPKAAKVLQLKYLRATDHLELEKMQKKRKSEGTVQDERFLVETLARRTVSIDGKPGPEALYIQFYESMKSKDGYAIRDRISTLDFGINLQADGSCTHCGEGGKFTVRLDSTFFRPFSGGAEAED